ncbi:type ISP restriction/modification enzyme [Dictyobacter halimunensis]
MANIALRAYLEAVEENYRRGFATEHTYRGTLKHLLEQIEAGVFATNEPKRIACGAPDYVIERNNLTIGYIEAKDVGVPLDKIEKDAQLKRYLRALDNLILTDYLEFRWYVQGEKRMSARLGSIHNKKIILDKDGVKLGEELLHLFLEHRGERIRKPQELAQRMARLAHMIRDIIIDAFRTNEASDTIKDLYTVFQELLLPDLTADGFADMFAQTIAYGLFAARCNHHNEKPFRREDAVKEIPRTNPFLRRFFGAIAGPDLDDEPFVGFVNELAQVLAFTDMKAVLADFGKRTRQEDPIVHFYETFLAQYDPKLREMRGVYYTPEPVVSYIVRSVDYLLREHFDCPDGLADTGSVPYSYVDEHGKEQVERKPRVMILDPATGTGTFLYSVIAHIRENYRQMGNAGMWSGYVRDYLLPRLFGFELLVAPYAMAHLKLGMQLAALDFPEPERKSWAYDFKTNERLGIYLTNTLDEAFKRSNVLFGRYISDEANEAAKVKQTYPVMVILGNPPYSYASANTGKWITSLIRDYYQVDNKPLGERNPKGLQDDYVKFIRFAQWRIEQTGYGILAFITNHKYFRNATFPGMRQSLMRTFDDIYLLDLHGSTKPKEVPPVGTQDQNVFDIQQGVAIGIFVKRHKSSGQDATVLHADLWGSRASKYDWLVTNDVATTSWTTLTPQRPFYYFFSQDRNKAEEYERGWKLTEIMPTNSVGLYTARDTLAIQRSKTALMEVLNTFVSLPVEEARKRYDLGRDSRDWQVALAQKDLRRAELKQSNVQEITYRPFDVRFTYYTGVSRGLICMPRAEVMHHMLDGSNIAICFMRASREQIVSNFFVANHIIDKTILSSADNANIAPLYLYSGPNKAPTLFDLDTSIGATRGRNANLSGEFVKDASTKLKMLSIPDGKGDLQRTFGPEDIFHYMYAIFYSPSYRERYAEFLKVDFPRLPLPTSKELFRELCALGARLVAMHLMKGITDIAVRYPISGNNIVDKISYTQGTDTPGQGRVWINKAQYFEGIQPEIWEFHVGGYQICQKWLKDRKGDSLTFEDIMQYQRMATALAETITVMAKIDDAIHEHGGWPLQ